MEMKLVKPSKEVKISKYIYSHFAEHLGRCIYEGVWVGKDSDIPHVNGIRQDVVEALKAIQVPLVRWPGGCFADEYHWRDGVGPQEERATIVNTHWGGVTEDNSFGTHEYYEFLKQIHADAYVVGNVGSGTVQEMQDWVQYITMEGKSPMSDLRRKNGQEEPWEMPYFGVGNESWGCGGNMRPEYYADEYRRYQTYVRQYGDKKIYKIACGANVADYNWTEVLMREAGRYMDGLSLHYYTIPTGNWQDKGNATGFPEEEYYETMKKTKYMDELIEKHGAIMDKYDPEKRVGLIIDEWGTWYNVEPGSNPGFLYQQNSIRDAVLAAINFDIFHKHAERVHMTNIAQMVNVLQAVLLTEGEKMIKTPTYHVFDLYQKHMDAVRLDITGETDEFVSHTASMKENQVTISLSNYHLTEPKTVTFHLSELSLKEVSEAAYLCGEKMDDHNTFEEPEKVRIQEFQDYVIEGDTLKVELPPMSIATLTLK